MRNKKVIFSVNTQLKKVSGVEKVTMDIHHAIRDDYDAKIVGNIPFSKIPTDLNINSNEYIRFCNPFMFKDSVVFVHERKLLVLFWVLNTFFFQKIEIIDNFVPNSFFIQNYISRKIENLKEYIDDNNNKIIQKKDLKKYIFLSKNNSQVNIMTVDF